MATEYHNEARLSRIEDKIDKVVDRVGSIDVTLAAQHVSLKEHIRRTAILEQELKPIQKHVAMVSGMFKFIGLVATIGAIVEAAVTALTYLKS